MSRLAKISQPWQFRVLSTRPFLITNTQLLIQGQNIFQQPLETRLECRVLFLADCGNVDWRILDTLAPKCRNLWLFNTQLNRELFPRPDFWHRIASLPEESLSFRILL